MAEKIYPGGPRLNCFAGMYCEIALESYYNAMISYGRIKDAEYSWDAWSEYYAMEKSIISTIIFSAMCIEAFFNDYAATCLGDSDFYDNFDKLAVLDKFELIARFILKSKVERSKSYYSRLKSLIKNRNLYIHNKSKNVDIKECTLEELQAFEEASPICEFECEQPKLNSAEIKNDMRIALDALKTIHEVAVYFDERDENIFATTRIFGNSGFFQSESEKQYKSAVLPLLGIKVISYEV